jgi:hypothetical protein
MNKFQGLKARRAAAAIVTASVLAAGLLSATASMAGSDEFDRKMSSVIGQIKADPSYRKIPLDTSADRQWFYDQSAALFEKKITKAQYVDEGSRKFPGYEASFDKLADLFTAS